MKRLVIIGDGGHAKAILAILQEMGGFDIAGCPGKTAGACVAVLGDDGLLPDLYAGGVRHARRGH
jgi:hypothetical protein